jgi:hypothetical protein
VKKLISLVTEKDGGNMEVAIIGAVLGALLFMGKLGIFYLLTSKKNAITGDLEQRMWPKYFLWGPSTPLRDRIHDSTFLLVCVDTLSGYLGMHIFAAFNGGIMAMVGMTVYSIICAVTIGQEFIMKWISKRISFPKRSSKSKYAWQE